VITYESVLESAEALRLHVGEVPEVAVVLGSGLGAFADTFEDAVAIPYAELPGFPVSTVLGHVGRLVVGQVAGRRVAALQGRSHLYEGHPAWRTTLPIRALALLGVRVLVLTNAAGGIRGDLQPGDLLRITDHLNLSGENPLTGPNDDRLGPRFPDLGAAYDPQLGVTLDRCAAELGQQLHQGVYAFLRGPSYETPAEVRMLRTLGADVVGMSTVPETIVAAHMGMEVVALSCVTNLAAGISPAPLRHEEVAAVAQQAAGRMQSLLGAFLAAL
jgi:purine-nucleoside phosphorylase